MVSAAYFLSIEFQETVDWVDSLYGMSYDRRPFYSEFGPDTQSVGQNVIVGKTGLGKPFGDKQTGVCGGVGAATAFVAGMPVSLTTFTWIC